MIAFFLAGQLGALGGFTQIAAAAPPESAEAQAESAEQTSARAPNEELLEKAREHFRMALKYEAEESWREAIAELRAALDIKATPGLHYHLGHCHEQLREPLLAYRHFLAAEELLADGHLAADVAAEIAPAKKRVRAQLSELILRGNYPEEAELAINGEVYSSAELGIVSLHEPGSYQIRASAPGYEPFEVILELKPNQQHRLELNLVPSARELLSAPTIAEPFDTAASASFPWKAVLLGAESLLVAAGLGLGVGFSIHAKNTRDEQPGLSAEIQQLAPEAGCGSANPEVVRRCAQYLDFGERSNRAQDRAYLGFIGAGLGGLALVATALFWPAEGSAIQPHAEINPQGGAALGFFTAF